MTNFKRLSLILVCALSGCASGLAPRPEPIQTPVSAEDSAAHRYLAELTRKKNRFLESYSEEDSAAQAPSATRPELARLPSDCAKMYFGNWSNSVRFGQDFAAYSNFVEYFRRCYGSNGHS